MPRAGERRDLYQTLVELLGLRNVSARYQTRAFFGRGVLLNLATRAQGDVKPSIDQLAEKANAVRSVLVGLGLAGTERELREDPGRDPRIARGLFTGHSVAFSGPLVQEGPVGDRPLDPNYIRGVLLDTGGSYSELRGRDHTGESAPRPAGGIDDGTAPRDESPLLFMVLRRAVLMEYESVALRALMAAGDPLVSGDLREPELVVTGESPDQPTPEQIVARFVDVLLGGDDRQLVRGIFEPDMLRDFGLTRDEVEESSDFWASLEYLADLDSGRLALLLPETLDVVGHRYDAWETSIASRRLDVLREKRPEGIQIGGYGWLESVLPDTGQADAPSEGFIHAPSLAQATTGAVLYDGFLSHRHEAQGASPLSMDLSSGRVRAALRLLDGIREGHQLGALLGYEFERGLREAEEDPTLDRLVLAFRQVAPLVTGKREAARGEGVEPGVHAIGSADVVDGLALLRRTRAGEDVLSSALALIDVPLEIAEPVYDRLVSDLEDRLDAVGDLMTAEGVHQLLTGNPDRATAALDTIARADVQPPVPDVIRTPRSGVGITHRLVALVNAPAPGSEATSVRGWRSDAPRALAEPTLNELAAALLDDASKVWVRGEFRDGSGLLRESRHLSLSELGLCPLDLIYMPLMGRVEAGSELERRIAYAFLNDLPPGLELAEADLRISSDESAVPTRLSGDSDVGLDSFLARIPAARSLLTGGRPLNDLDFVAPDQAAESPTLDLSELRARAHVAHERLREEATRLKTRLALDEEDPTASDLSPVLFRLAAFGIRDAVPPWTLDASWAGRSELRERAEAALEIAVERLAVSSELGQGGADGGGAERLGAIFGDEFKVLPRFVAKDADELAVGLSAHAELVTGSPDAPSEWLSEMRRVRTGVARLSAALETAAGTGHALNGADLRVAHLPARDGSSWIGGSIPTESLGSDRISLVRWSASEPNTREPLAGLLIDEWTEIVPERDVSTGLSFQYDAPEAQAPQAILLAVPPDPSKPWSRKALEDVLISTLELARIRAVDPDALMEVGHLLPAIYLPDVTELPDNP